MTRYWTCAWAAFDGDLSCLKNAHKNGAPLDTWTCIFAAHKGHLDCLKYAHENGAPLEEYTCTWAAENGHIDCLRYAYLMGAQWSSPTPEIVEWKEGLIQLLKLL